MPPGRSRSQRVGLFSSNGGFETGTRERHLDLPLPEGMEKSEEDLNALASHRSCGSRLSLTKVIYRSVELHRNNSMYGH